MKIKLTIYRFLTGKRLLLAIMKTFILLICTAAFSLNVETALSQEQVTIETDTVLSVDEIFYLIQDQTKYRFLYPQDLFENSPKVPLKKGVMRISELLKLGFSGINVEYQLSKDNVIVIEKKPEYEKSNPLIGSEIQGFQISGSITDINGQPLVGATIIEKGTSNGASSDFDGNFRLTTVDGNSILVVSYIGFATQEIALNGENQIVVVLKEDAAGLD